VKTDKSGLVLSPKRELPIM